MPGIDRGIGLDHVDAGALLAEGEIAALGRHHADAEAVAEIERAADGHDPVAHLGRVGIAQLENGERLLRLDLDDGDVGARVLAEDLRVVALARGQGDGDAVGFVHHVTVGHDGAVGVDDEARSAGALILLARSERIVVAEEGERQLRVPPRLWALGLLETVMLTTPAFFALTMLRKVSRVRGAPGAGVAERGGSSRERSLRR